MTRCLPNGKLLWQYYPISKMILYTVCLLVSKHGNIVHNIMTLHNIMRVSKYSDTQDVGSYTCEVNEMTRTCVWRKMGENRVTSKNTVLLFSLYLSLKDPCFPFTETRPPSTQIFPPWKIPGHIINRMF